MSLTALASAIFNFLLIAAGLTALIMIIWGGVNYLTSAGDPSKARDAKKRVFAAILGLIILFSSWMILNTINPDLVNIKEPANVPPPEIQQPEKPIEPTPETPAAFYYVPLGKIIDEAIAQEQKALPEMRKFADLAVQCSRDLCEGGQCEYEVQVCDQSCNEVCDQEDNCHEECEEVCRMETRTCEAPCNTDNPCPAEKDEIVNNVLATADKMEEEMSRLQQGKQKISECVTDEEAIMLSCQEASDMFGPNSEDEPLPQWDNVKNCRQGYDFYCVYGADEDITLDKIILPFETIKEGIDSVRDLKGAVENCSCSNCSYCCECCAACSGSPCPSQTDDASASATEAADELEIRLQTLEETVAEIAGLSATDEIATLTCSKAYSWLKSIKQEGCPSVKAFPCCPIDTETEKTIRSCRVTDFFFCSAP